MTRFAAFSFVPVLAILLVACGGGGTAGDASPKSSAGSPAGFSSDQVKRLEDYVQRDMQKHGVAIGCAWLMRKFGDSTVEKSVELAGVPGKWLDPWATGTIGNLDTGAKTQFSTLYDGKASARHTSLRRLDGDGYVCFVSQ